MAETNRLCACGHRLHEHAAITTEEIERGECRECSCQRFAEPQPYSLVAEENAMRRLDG